MCYLANVPYGRKRFKTRHIIEIEVTASTESQADRRWNNVLEKLKYQTTDVKITQQLEPYWEEIVDDEQDGS